MVIFFIITNYFNMLFNHGEVLVYFFNYKFYYVYKILTTCE